MPLAVRSMRAVSKVRPILDPVRRADDSFITEAEDLPADGSGNPAGIRIADPGVSLAKIPHVLVRRRIRHVLVEENPRVLCDGDNFEPIRWLYVEAYSELGQIVNVVCGRIAEADLTFNPVAELRAKSQPGRERFVEFRNWEQPTIRIGPRNA